MPASTLRRGTPRCRRSARRQRRPWRRFSPHAGTVTESRRFGRTPRPASAALLRFHKAPLEGQAAAIAPLWAPASHDRLGLPAILPDPRRRHRCRQRCRSTSQRRRAHKGSPHMCWESARIRACLQPSSSDDLPPSTPTLPRCDPEPWGCGHRLLGVPAGFRQSARPVRTSRRTNRALPWFRFAPGVVVNPPPPRSSFCVCGWPVSWDFAQTHPIFPSHLASKNPQRLFGSRQMLFQKLRLFASSPASMPPRGSRTGRRRRGAGTLQRRPRLARPPQYADSALPTCADFAAKVTMRFQHTCWCFD